MREAFRQAAEYFVQVVDQVPDDGWQSAALDVWTVCDLVGHTSRSLSNVETYSAKPGSRVDIQTQADYFRRAMESLAAPNRRRDEDGMRGAIWGPSLLKLCTRSPKGY